MEDWADSILSTLEVNLDKFLGAVKRGRERLHERSQETVVAGRRPRADGARGSRPLRVGARLASPACLASARSPCSRTRPGRTAR